MIRNLFRRKKPLVKKNQPPISSKKKHTPLKKSVKKTTEKILTAEGWKRLMMRSKKVKKT